MFTDRLTMTDTGKALLLRAMAGETLTFTRMAIGSGALATGQDRDALTELIHEEISVDVTRTMKDGRLMLAGSFDSGEVDHDFMWRELGIFAAGEDDEEMLYAYGNDGENADLLPALAEGVYTEQTLTAYINVDNVENVTIDMDTMAYVTRSELNTELTEIGAEMAGKANVAKLLVKNLIWDYDSSSNKSTFSFMVQGATGFVSILSYYMYSSSWAYFPAGCIAWKSNQNGVITLTANGEVTDQGVLYLLVQEVDDSLAGSPAVNGILTPSNIDYGYAKAAANLGTSIMLYRSYNLNLDGIFMVTLVTDVANGDDVCSIYVVRSVGVNLSILATLYEGTSASAPRLSSNGILTLSTSTTESTVRIKFEYLG